MSIKFQTSTGRSIDVAFCESVFIDWMNWHGRANINVEEQIRLYLYFMFKPILAVNEKITKIDYPVSITFMEDYNITCAILKYRI